MKHPRETAVVYFEINRTNDNVLVDPSEFNIRIKDPSGSTRIVYNSSLLSNESTGIYRYTFQVPDRVLPGEWHVEISAKIGSYTTVTRVFFGVGED